jgi:hypothetical protein
MMRPLDFAPFPDRPARKLFTAAAINAELRRLVDQQQADGGWPVDFRQLLTAAVLGWRGHMTVRAVSIPAPQLHDLIGYGHRHVVVKRQPSNCDNIAGRTSPLGSATGESCREAPLRRTDDRNEPGTPEPRPGRPVTIEGWI